MTAINSEFSQYASRLSKVLEDYNWGEVGRLADSLHRIWLQKDKLFICGNGGSAANAAHFANDFLYGVGAGKVPGIDVEALPSNFSVLTCLANDVGYESIFSCQLEAKGKPTDLLIVLSGSGNSLNVVAALEVAKTIGMETWAIVGYDGGESAKLADNSIHVAVEDMQMSEDFQSIIAHMCMQSLKKRIT